MKSKAINLIEWLDLQRLNVHTREGLFNIALCWFWMLSETQGYVHAIVKMFMGSDNADAGVGVVNTIFLLMGLPYIFRRIRSTDLVFYVFFFTLYVISILISTGSQYVFLTENAYSVLVLTVPLLFIGISAKPNKIANLLYVLSIICVVGDLLFTIYFQRDQEHVGDQMARAYALLPHLCMVAYYMLNKTTLLNVIVFLVGFISLFTMGCRGAIVSFFLFVLLYQLFVQKSKKSLFITIIIVFTVIAFIEPIISFVFDFSSEFNMSTRLVDKFIEGEFGNSESRDDLRTGYINMIQSNPLIFRGVAGDCIGTINYAHNIIIELLVSYGVIFGGLFFLSLCIIIIRSFFSVQNLYEKAFVILLVSCFFFPLFLSGTYRTSIGFWMMLGYCLQQIRLKKKSHKLEYNY